MAPKKRKAENITLDIRTFYKKKSDTVSGTPSTEPRQMTSSQMPQMRVKEEQKAGVLVNGHTHLFKVKFGSEDRTYNISCDQPRTLLEAIKSHLGEEFNEKIKCADENIIIKRGKGDNSSLVATHFPCSCLFEGECLTIRASTKVVEAQRKKKYQVQEKERYTAFYIDKEGGKDSKSKANQIFRCSYIAEEFKYFCVYALKDMTVEEALKQDGRFVDNLTGFQLSNNSENNDFTKCTETVKRLHRGRYKICLPKQGQSKGKNLKQQTSNQQGTQQKNQHELNDSQCTAVNGSQCTAVNGSQCTAVNGSQCTAVNDSQCSSETREVLKLARENSISLKMAAEKTGTKINLNEIQDLLRQQFPQLKELMEKRFPGQSLKKALNLQRENFGKIQQAFSEVHRVRELLDLSRSVCLLMVHDKASSLSVQGTGFVLFDNFILTNAHLFDPWAKDGIEKWWEHVKISAEFNFENLATESRKKLKAKLFEGNLDLDFALLELVPENLNTGQAIEKDEVPPGLLKKFGPLPMDGHACLIGHPAGGVKKMDPTCVIRKEEHGQAVNKNLDSYKDYIFTIYAINQNIKDDPRADICVTYNTFMYHGSSGSPVFDAYGRVFGLHTGGFFFGYPKPNESVIEYAFPLLAIFEKLVSSQEKKGNYVFLNRVLMEAEGNRYLEKIIKSVVGPRENGHEVQESEP